MLFLTGAAARDGDPGNHLHRTGHSAGDNSPQLDVLLVTNEVPEAQSNEQASYLAQRTQLGNGNTEAPPPPDQSVQPGRAGHPDRSGRGSGNDHEVLQDKSLLATTSPNVDIRHVTALNGGAEPLPQFVGDNPRRAAQRPWRSRGADAAGQIERRALDHARYPRLAAGPLLASWKRKVKRVGTLNFPIAARNARLSGSPVVEVEITADGRLKQAKVQRSSGQVHWMRRP